ncbi:MAG: Rrf2 family transcriptional regulator, partial [Terriglobia bacterium]
NGGMYLRQPAREVNLGTLIRETEHDFALAECFGPNNRCVITPACRLRHVLHEALQAFLAVLDRYTLADLLIDGADLRSLLEIESAPIRWGRPRAQDS